MSEVTRQEALKRLRESLTDEQIADIKLVIETAEMQGDYHFNGEYSVWSDDVNGTLTQLSNEFRREEPAEPRVDTGFGAVGRWKIVGEPDW